MLQDCDYLANESSVFGVKGTYPPGAREVYVKPVYQRRHGQWHKVVDEPGPSGEQFVVVSPAELRHVEVRVRPTDIEGEAGPWGNMYRALRSLGVPADRVGNFGSRRLSEAGFAFQPKDTDFVVYGLDACLWLRSRMASFHELAGTSPISRDHIESQVRRHARPYDPTRNTFHEMLSRKWSSCQIADGLCSTLRFVALAAELDHGLSVADCLNARGKPIEVEGVVCHSLGMSFVPRRFELECADGVREVVTAGWIFHQAVRDGDRVVVLGISTGRRVVLNRYEHGIRIVNAE